MNSGLLSIQGASVFRSAKPAVHRALVAANELHFPQALDEVKTIQAVISNLKNNGNAKSEGYLTDLYVLGRYLDFLENYVTFWSMLIKHQFSDSWSALQDALDMLRLIKRFSKVNVGFFESQLLEVEKLYPYKIFFSIGMAVDWFECSICGKDIDSKDCLHLRGNLYSGVMAQAIGRDVAAIDHLAVVTNPEDKRCVASFDDSADQFKLVRFLAGGLLSRDHQILDFAKLRYSKRRVPNPDYIRLGRNELCFCKSGKKFKRCCASKQHLEKDHIDIVFEPRISQEILSAIAE